MMDATVAVLIALVALSMVTILALVLKRSRGPDGGTGLDERLDSMNRELGGLTQSHQRLLEIGQDMRKLREVLAAPTLRGGFGEQMLEELLRQVLPAGAYHTQHTFRNGQRVDAVIRLTEGLVPVDAKFPLEGFQRLMESDSSGRKTQLARFHRDVKGHIDDIATKYICPGETLDFALMYIPAENVYYEIVRKEKGQADILSYAWDRRVITTSPNSFYAYLQVIALGLRGLQVEQNAKAMLESLTRLKGDFDRFSEDYRLVGTHLGRAQAKYSEGVPRLESIQRGLPGQLKTAALDPASDTDAQWEYGPPTSKRGRSRNNEEPPSSDGIE
jgi:DNA recombination protein RmuC